MTRSMGHAVDIFTSQPPACYHCAVCHDVLQSAVSFKECGHSFCEECAEACDTCPHCRVEVLTTGFNPNFIVREAIGSMEVKCPNRGDVSNKRARGNDGEAVPVSADGCNWKGKCEELENHEKVCDFEIIRCSIDGCNHECLRKDMSEHLSGGNGFLLHMNLMKQSITTSYEAKMRVMEQSCHSKMKSIQQSNLKEVEKIKKSYDKKMESMKASYKTKIADMKESYDGKMKDMERSTTKQLSELKDEIKSMQSKVPAILPPLRLRPQTRMTNCSLEDQLIPRRKTQVKDKPARRRESTVWGTHLEELMEFNACANALRKAKGSYKTNLGDMTES
eukprot:scaffold30656_cov62-Cyclotella_meneghiniana.AAC.5